MAEIEFVVIGTPCAKGRPRFVKRGQFMSTYTPETTISYENLVKVEYARQCGKQVLDGALSVEIVAFFPVPKSESKKRTALMEDGAIYHTKKPDADNLAKCVLDAINGIAFKDDSQVAKMTVVKKYARQPHTTVKLAEMEVKL